MYKRLAVAAGVVVVLFALAGPAGARVRELAQSQTTCSLPVAVAPPGAKVSAGIEHVAPGTQVTLTFDGGAVGDAVADEEGAAVVSWIIPLGTTRGDHPVVFVGEGVYCEPSAPVTVGSADAANRLAEGTVGAAAGRAPAIAVPQPSGARSGLHPLAIIVAVLAAAAVVTGSALAGRGAWRRRGLRIPG